MVGEEDWNSNDEEACWPAGHVLSTWSVGGELVWIESCWNEDEMTTVVMLPEER